MSLTHKLTRRLSLVARAARGDLEAVRRDDMGEDFWALARRAAPYTQTSPERLYALYEAVRHVCRARIAGDVVECGVWRGGSAMLAALTLAECQDPRRLWLYDTYTGMPEASECDRDIDGADSRRVRAALLDAEGGWNVATLKEVRANLATTGYDPAAITYVKGLVEDTIPAQAPERIALLRLDTDFYASTRHELRELWPRLSPGGILIIDDYGHFAGARQAVDEYFADEPVALARIDYTARLAVKPGRAPIARDS